jgi:hypothetical protein
VQLQSVRRGFERLFNSAAGFTIHTSIDYERVSRAGESTDAAVIRIMALITGESRAVACAGSGAVPDGHLGTAEESEVAVYEIVRREGRSKFEFVKQQDTVIDI